MKGKVDPIITVITLILSWVLSRTWFIHGSFHYKLASNILSLSVIVAALGYQLFLNSTGGEKL